MFVKALMLYCRYTPQKRCGQTTKKTTTTSIALTVPLLLLTFCSSNVYSYLIPSFIFTIIWTSPASVLFLGLPAIASYPFCSSSTVSLLLFSLFGLLFDPEDGWELLFRNIDLLDEKSSSEISIYFFQTTRSHNPEDSSSRSRRCEDRSVPVFFFIHPLHMLPLLFIFSSI
jgi:hypothetical protein